MAFAKNVYEAAIQGSSGAPTATALTEAAAVRNKTIIEMYLRGMTSTEVGALPNVRMSGKAVQWVLTNAGIPMRPRGFRLWGRLADEGTAVIVDRSSGRYQAKFVPMADVLKAAIPKTTAPVKAGKQVRRPRMAGAPERPIYDGEIKRLYVDDEMGAPEIARRLGLTESYVSYALRHRLGVTMRSRTEAVALRPAASREGRFFPHLRTRNAEIVRRFQEDGLSLDTLGREYKLTSSRIHQILKMSGVHVARSDWHTRTKKKAARLAAKAGATPTPPKAAPTQTARPALPALSKAPTPPPARVPEATLLRSLEQVGVILSAVTAIASDLGIVVNPDGTIERPNGSLTGILNDVDKAIGKAYLDGFAEGMKEGRAVAVETETDDSPLSNGRPPETHDEGTLYHDTGLTRVTGGGRLPPGWRYMTEEERLRAWADRGGTPPDNLVIRDTRAIESEEEVVHTHF